jgi:dihydrodipicolinate synthase/N-acetylneuraminate lyase
MALALKAKQSRPGLTLLDGFEFDCVRYLKAGYDGLLLGGGVFNGFIACRIWEAAMAGDFSRAERLQKKMNRIMYAVYGGKKIRAWLSGEKYLLVRMGIFATWRNHPDYPLTEADQRRIESVLEKESEWLLP